MAGARGGGRARDRQAVLLRGSVAASLVPHPGHGGRMTMPPIVGIDLGTTNSLMAYVDYRTGLPRVIPDHRGQVLVPSVVSFRPEGLLVGDEAKRLLAQEPGSTVFSAKRLLGRSYDDAAPELAYLPFAVLPGETTTRLLVGDREITPTEVSAIVLKALKEQAGA